MSTPATRHTDRMLGEAGQESRLKVCGITDPAEIEILSSAGVDFVGLWLAVPGGPHDLPLPTWQALAEQAAARPSPAPVLVTFTKDIEVLRSALADAPVQWVQLHGYPTPGTVRKIKAISPEIRVIKVLHVKGGECVEESLIPSYEKAGVDVFLFDAVSEDGRVGSTGESLDPAVVSALADKLNRPFLLAGGISAENRDRYQSLTRHRLYLGVDVDTNARGGDGKIANDSVAAISRAWKTRDQEGEPDG